MSNVKRNNRGVSCATRLYVSVFLEFLCWSVRLQVLQVSDMSLGEGKLAQSTQLFRCACQLFDAGTRSNVQDFAFVFQLASREVTNLCIFLPVRTQSLFKILAIKDSRKASSFGTRGTCTSTGRLYS